MAAVKFTTDTLEIRGWAELRGGVPATIRGSANEDAPGILRISLPSAPRRANLQALTWDEFFLAVELNELAFMYDDRACRLVGRSLVAANGRRPRDARPKRRIGAITLLERQHRGIEAMFHRLHEREDDHAGKAELFTRIADALAAHTKVEETIFYPVVLGGETEVEQCTAVADHLAVKQALSELLGVQPRDPRFDVGMKALQELVERHFGEEEDDLFEMIEGLDREARLELGARMQRIYEQLLQTEPRLEVPDELDYALLG
ncbi:MAG TPA: hemerythrin domain-containing protein [Nannocystaceae bacterium]|nr:hemerythrin domain-containing protein [Nannocystaceae bacterium]